MFLSCFPMSSLFADICVPGQVLVLEMGFAWAGTTSNPCGIFKRICPGLFSLALLFQPVPGWFGGRQAAGGKSVLHSSSSDCVHEDTCK